ncbi:MAG: hypothetical protein JSV17_12000 [Candidatus Aminicenantes bacterium]|nr:MAG: hypothetical protein JSV17_12000 [Candidatus Aminicenantes bacterium]
MNFPASHPLWMWLYFGTFGTIGIILFTLIVWNLMKVLKLADGFQRSAAKWSMIGFMFLFFSAWFACGIGGSPGNLLSTNPDTHYLTGAILAAALAMFFSVPGWLCVLIGQRKMLRALQQEKE